jgi:hypothetical protein
MAGRRSPDAALVSTTAAAATLSDSIRAWSPDAGAVISTATEAMTVAALGILKKD